MKRARDLGYNHEQGRLDLREGIGKARTEAAMPGRVTQSTEEGVDIFIDNAPTSLKGPLLNGSTGADIAITDAHIDDPAPEFADEHARVIAADLTKLIELVATEPT